MTYMFYQEKGGETKWECALASERQNLVGKGSVEFVTALDVDNSFQAEMPLEDRLSVRYSGPFYLDFDGKLDGVPGDDADDRALEEALSSAKLVALKLKDVHGFDVSQGRWYFTGGRGVHIEVPHEVLVAKPNRQGVVGLPLIYKEIALSLYEECLDMRIYSCGRGRMWRVPNVLRSNGLYKVQVSFDELMGATTESYRGICSAPRDPLPVSPPTFNPKLALIYSQGRDRVEAGFKKRKSKKNSSSVAKNFNGEWPDSVKLLMAGEGLKKGLGWNQIALQIASLSLAIGKSEAQMVEDCRNLIDNHSGDSNRYGSPAKRERELRNQYRYQDGTVTYEFSIGGVKSLFERGAYTQDLDYNEFVPDPEETVGTAPDGTALIAAPNHPSEDEIKIAEEESKARLKVNASRAGMFAKGDDGWYTVSACGITNPTMLIRLSDAETIGFEVEVHVDKRHHGRHMLPMSALTSKASLQTWLSKFAVSVMAPDNYVPNFADFLRLNTKKDNKMLTVSREGVDVITPPTTDEYPEGRPTEIIFSSANKVLSTEGTPLRFRGVYDPTGAFKTDLWAAPDLVDTPETRDYFDNLFEINSPINVAKLIGWFTACFMCQPIRESFKQFPILQSWGAAGSGKSKSTELFSHMHYYRHDPKKLSSTGSTFFPIMAAVTQSASIPVLFDEYKPREMTKYNKDLLTNIFRSNYEGNMIERGTLNKDAGTKETAINSFFNVAPIGFIGEAIEAQSAIMERCISIDFSKASRANRSAHFDKVFVHRRGGPLSSLGKVVAQHVMASSVPGIGARVTEYRESIRGMVSKKVSDDSERPMFNMAVVLTGLDMFRDSLQSVFGERYNSKVETLKASLYESTDEILIVTMSEASKCLDVLAQLTRVQDETFKLTSKVDYQVSDDREYVDIKLKPVFAKYVRYCRSLGQEALYDNDKAFIEGLARHQSLIGRGSDIGSPPFRVTPFETIFRFSIAKMEEEKIDSFI